MHLACMNTKQLLNSFVFISHKQYSSDSSDINLQLATNTQHLCEYVCGV